MLGQMHGNRGFADTALEVRYRNDGRHILRLSPRPGVEDLPHVIELGKIIGQAMTRRCSLAFRQPAIAFGLAYRRGGPIDQFGSLRDGIGGASFFTGLGIHSVRLQPFKDRQRLTVKGTEIIGRRVLRARCVRNLGRHLLSSLEVSERNRPS